jgi:hypothetical protein
MVRKEYSIASAVALQDFDPGYDRGGSQADLTPFFGDVRFTPGKRTSSATVGMST